MNFKGLQHIAVDIDAFRQQIIEHCRQISTLDRAYAVWAFKNYAASMPWLELK